MPQNEVVSLPRAQREMAPQAYSFAEIERLADYIAKSRLFGLATREQAIVMMSIAQAEGRHPAQAAKDYNVIQGRPSKTAEAMQRDFMQAGGRIEWHDLSDDIAAATFSHPQGGSIRILWDMPRAAKAGLSGKDMWKKYPRQMLRARCVSEGVKTIYPAATGGFYTPEEVRDMPMAALPEVAADTTADLDQFAKDSRDRAVEELAHFDAMTGEVEPPPSRDILAEAREVAAGGAVLFREFWQGLSPPERDSIRVHLVEFQTIAKTADDPFGLPPLPAAETVTEAEQPVVARDVFAELDHEARAATREGERAFEAWWKTLRRGDADLIRAFRDEYRNMALAVDAQRGLAL